MKWQEVDLGALSVAAASRDLRAPLVRLRQLSFELSDAKGQNQVALDQMQLTLDEMFRLVGQLAQVTKPLNNELELEPIQLDGLIQEVSCSLKPLCHSLKRDFVCELPTRKRLIAVGNYQTLSSILTRFMSDALHYNVEQRPVELSVQASRDDQVKVAICDYGSAFDDRRDQTLLATSNLADNLNPIHTRPLMSSLNLLLASKLAQAMHGHIELHRHRKGGVTIETYLPLSHQLSLLGVQ